MVFLYTLLDGSLCFMKQTLSLTVPNLTLNSVMLCRYNGKAYYGLKNGSAYEW